MSRESFLAAQKKEDPFYDRNQVIARVHLDLALALTKRRERLGYTLEQLEQRTGISIERLEMIEEEDTTFLPELLALAHELGLALVFDGASAFEARPQAELRFLFDRQDAVQRSGKRSIA
jgi:transcriptional regulator with XRE-family HTH domain